MANGSNGTHALDDFSVDPGYSFVHRRHGRVVKLNYGGEITLVAGREELRAALMNPEVFSSQHHFPNGHSPFLGVMTPPTPVRAVPIELDPPAHTEFRQALATFFKPAAVQSLAPEIQELATWCIDQHIESGAMDLFHDLAKLVPAMTTMRLIGLPKADARIIADGVHSMSEDRFALSPTWVVLVKATTDAVRERRKQPRDDLISHLLSIHIADRPLTDTEIFEVCFTMVVGGMATTARLLLGSLSHLSVHTDDRARLIKHPEFIPDAIEEFLRYYSPVPILCRTATSDFAIGKTCIKEGARVGMGYAAANRDPEAIHDPDAIHIDRQQKGHMALGFGPHHCIGATLGRLEARLVIEMVLERMPDFALNHDELCSRWEAMPPTPSARGISWAERVQHGLPVTFTPSSSRHALDGFKLRSLSDHLRKP